MADLLENLNDRQREAVLETEGYVRVIAGAGSGKTKLLVSRYAYLVQDYGIDGANILCVTFTNKAAGEMKKRIRGLIGDGNDTSLISTYHGFCNRLLRENPEKLFLNKQFQIIDAHQQKAVLSEIYQKYELKLDYASFESILRKIGKIKKDTGYVPRMCNPRPCQILPEVKTQDDRMIEEFLQRQKATYSLDFHDLISFAIYLLETDGEVREKWQDRLNYIMVDEFQDSSAVEMRLVEILSGKYRNLMIVGDPDQNIYEWRGSDVRLLVEFDKEHEPTKTIFLNQNYRSTPQILRCANTLIEKNELRLKKDLFTRNPPGASVVHYHSKDDFEEMDQVVALIKELCAKEKLRYSDFAILYRSGFLSRIAEKKLVEKNIPYEIFGGVRFYQRMEILDMLAYLKLIAFGDDDSFRRVVNTPRRRFGRAKMNLLEARRERDAAEGVDSTLFDALGTYLEEGEFAGSDVGPFVSLICKMRAQCGEKRISEVVNDVARDSGYESYIRELGDEERLDNLAEFKRIANEFEREFGENLSLEEFLRQIALQSGEEGDESKDAVKLMTIHSSKGLEFPAVFILGFTEGVFPSGKTLGERKKLGLEEERRLCYVAITRAQRHLFLMESEGTSQNGMKKLMSRFLEDIGEKNYVRIGRVTEELVRESRGYTARLNREMQQGPDVQEVRSRGVGDVVEHHIFGKGVIESVDARRGSYTIRFEKLGQPRNISSSYFQRAHEDARKNYPAREEAPRKEGRETVTAREEGPGKEGRETAAAREEEGIQWEEGGISADPEAGILPRETEKSVESGAEISCGEMLKSVEPEAESPRGDLPAQNPTLPAPAVCNSADTLLPVADKEEPDGLLPRELEDADGGNADFEIDEIGLAKARLKELKENSPNLWKHPEVPHLGWNCVGVEDLGAPVGICEMCGYQIIRYAHHMEHPQYRNLTVGCVCAGKMEGDVAGAKRREAEFKNREARRVKFIQHKWKQSQKGNEYLKIDGHIVVLYHNARMAQVWKFSIDNTFCQTAYATREKALAGAFEALERLRV